MSYNIDTWKTKKLKNLEIPVEAFYRHPRKDWHPKQPVVVDVATMKVRVNFPCGGGEVEGVLKDGFIHVESIDLYSEGSGGFMVYVLEGALKESRGELEAVLVWEGGDSITRLSVKDGVVTEKEVEL